MNRKRAYVASMLLTGLGLGVGLALLLGGCSAGSGGPGATAQAAGHGCWIQATDGNDTLAISVASGDCSALAAAVQNAVRDTPMEMNATASVTSPPASLPPSHCSGTLRGHRLTVYNLGSTGPSTMDVGLNETGCN